MIDSHSSQADIIHGYLDAWSRRLRLQRSLAWCLRSTAVGLGLGASIAVVALVQGRLLRSEYALLVLGASALGLLGGAGGALLWPLHRSWAARHLDHRLRLSERLSTALELVAGATRTSRQLADRQLRDTVQACKAVNIGAMLPLRTPRAEVTLLALLLILTLVPLRLGGDHFARSQKARALRQAIEAEAEEIQAMQQEIKASTRLSEEQREQLLDPLNAALEGLDQAENTEQAVAALTDTEAALRGLQAAEDAGGRQGLRRAGESLASEVEASDPLAEALLQADAQAASEALEGLDVSQLTDAERGELSERLTAAAESLRANLPELAAQLSEAADSLRLGELQAAEAALDDAAESLHQLDGDLAQSAAAEAAASELAEARGRLIQADGEGDAQAASGSSGSGTGAGPGSDGGQASQGSGPQSGGTEPGGGAGRGEGGPASTAGSEAGSSPIGQENMPGDGGERLYVPLGPGSRLGGSDGAAVGLPDSESSAEIILGEVESLPEAPSSSRVPYHEVFPQYEQQAGRAMDRLHPPAHLEGLIWRYFTSLAP